MEDASGGGGNNEFIYGRNAVIEALRSDVHLNKILLIKERGGSLGMIVGLAKEKGIVFSEVSKEKLDELTGTHNHQGVLAYLSSGAYCDLDDILRIAEERGESPFVLILDEIQDPHNLGAIIRTADAVGAHGVVIPKRRSVSLTAAVAKASAGAVSHVAVARVPNIVSAIETLKERGLWIAGADMSGETRFFDADLRGAVGLVIGGEGNGMGTLVKKKCDFILSIPMKGRISSLNASVAAGVVMYEIFKQRGSK